MTSDDDAEKCAYNAGHRAALASVFGHVARELAYPGDAPEKLASALMEERLLTVAALRQLCAEFGDNNWPDNLCLPDVIEKHLGRALRAREEEREAAELEAREREEDE
jgi:hypothetical protein